ncbi:MAG: GGDEF domain-containing phosphodiesterase [Longimicrobiales bacterium]|nr:GGDEF domain-containing phosphodiesterase [Longimicrobiales bacterium]
MRNARQPLVSDTPAVDSETGALNQALLLEVVDPILALARRNFRAMAVLHIRLADAVGTPELAGRATEAIRATVRGSDAVARLGPARFAVGLLEVREADAAVRVARRIIEALRARLGPLLAGSTRIGVAFFPHDASDGVRLLEAAIRATPETESLGFADEQLGWEALRRAGLRAALMDGDILSEFRLHYQPIRAVRGGRVVGAEALLRWERSGTLLPAGDFIGLVDGSGRSRSVDRWSMERAFRDLRTWRDAGWGGWISVNLSGPSMEDGELPEFVDRLLADTGAPADGIVFEVTERSALSSGGIAGDVLGALRRHGARIAVDDFGTGYASFEYLCNFDPDVVKLDRAFAVEPREPAAEKLLPMLVGMAHSLGKPVVVEGVELPAEWDRVAASECEFVQGYLTGRPVSQITFEERHLGLAA